ncbi:hypothetical protein QAD02_018952 [Eretmocerus hayati]|uniref:Uncharacterized protein n=1 Tax=Eretmocerus hayati TaxID=131215 RepID=A0ACC2PMZ5_9HYME|nr:hypothetical protein QAD02_018952 [Eretmocerus hayati]
MESVPWGGLAGERDSAMVDAKEQRLPPRQGEGQAEPVPRGQLVSWSSGSESPAQHQSDRYGWTFGASLPVRITSRFFGDSVAIPTEPHSDPIRYSSSRRWGTGRLAWNCRQKDQLSSCLIFERRRLEVEDCLDCAEAYQNTSYTNTNKNPLLPVMSVRWLNSHQLLNNWRG